MHHSELTALLIDLIALPKETEWVEFKLNNWKPEDIGQYLSALSNSACYHDQPYGYLIFGVEDGTHRATGTTFSPKTEKRGNQELENWLATQLEPRVDFSIFEFIYQGNNMVIFRVDATHSTPLRFKNEAFIRIGSYKKPLKEHPERERKIWAKSDKKPFEDKVVADKLTGSEVLKLLNYPKFFEMMGLPQPAGEAAILERLAQEKLLSRHGELWGITNLGAILFARNLNDFDTLKRKAVRLIFYDGNDRIKTQKEITGQKGYAAGFEGLVTYLSERLPSNEEIETVFRKEVPMYPLLALRELIANAIIHQDLLVSGVSVMVEVFQNRIEISNPGKPLIDTLRFIDHAPMSRNERLANFMRRLNICEERGSGIDKVVFQCELYQLPAPEFVTSDNYTRVTLYSPKGNKHMDKQDKIRACYQHSCLKYVSGEYMTNESLRQRFGIEDKNYPMASRIISDTIEENLIKMSDPENKSKKYTKYIPFWA